MTDEQREWWESLSAEEKQAYIDSIPEEVKNELRALVRGMIIGMWSEV